WCAAHPDASPPDAPPVESAACPASWNAAPAVDPTIAITNPSSVVLLHTRAAGTQSYQCTATTQTDGNVTYAWAFTGPKATLSDCNGDVIGFHSAQVPTAPQWANRDGSLVQGKRAAGITPDTTPIPCLLLSATP